jgi:hypothetical protein
MEELIKKIERAQFECVAGPLGNCKQWQQLKSFAVALEEYYDAVEGEWDRNDLKSYLERITAAKKRVREPFP